MNRSRIVLPTVVVTALASASLPACSTSRSESPSTRVDQLFAEWNKRDSPGCSLAVGRNGLYEHAYGMANLELGVPLTRASVLSAASISKQFTAMSIVLLAERGQLSLDDDVAKFFPKWVDHKSHITVRHLLGFTVNRDTARGVRFDRLHPAG